MAAKTIDLKLDRSGDGSPKEYTPPDYPTFTVESDEDHGIPDSGTCTIEFTKKEEVNSKDENSKRYRCTIEVQKMSNIKAGKGKADDTEEETPAEDKEEGGMEEEAPAKKSKRSPAVSAALEGAGEY